LNSTFLSDKFIRMNPPEETFSLLLVDDEPSVLSSLKRVFFEDDYQIHTAGNGARI
jgi:response regulator RpfG family c-di-GMP phosphodiesterase